MPAVSSHAGELQAIDTLIRAGASTTNSRANEIRLEWTNWYPSLSQSERNFSQSAWTKACDIRDRFQAAMKAASSSTSDPGRTSYADDLEAIDRFIHRYTPTSQPPVTSKANDIQIEWTGWYSGLSWTDRNFSKEAWTKGREIRDRFQAAMKMPAASYALSSEDLHTDASPASVVSDQAAQAIATAANTINWKPYALAIGAVGLLGAGGYVYYLSRLRYK